MAKVSHNILANLAGRAWTMLMGIAFVPIYLNLLGIEAYGLIGIFATLQGVLGIMDLGMGLTLNREFARTGNDQDNRAYMANLLRTLEIAYWSLSVLAGAIVVILAPWIAINWINAVHIPVESVESAIRMMGIVIALQAPFSFYQGGLMGLQKQVTNNLILAGTATLKGAGAALVIWILSPTIQAFFAWQVVVSGGATALTAWILWRTISGGISNARFDPAVLRNVWRFGLTVSANAIVGISLSQLDKLILLKLLPLEQFGYYALASVVASVLWAIILPINTALFPRFAQLHAQGNKTELATFYHKGCQLVAVLLLPPAITLIFFSREIMFLWTGNVTTSENTYLLVSMLALGTTINGLISVASYLQSAAGWPGLVLKTNSLLALVLVPVLLIVVPRFGAVGAAVVWVVINSAYLLVTVPIMHRRLLKGELMKWYLFDLFLPVTVVGGVVFSGHLLMPEGGTAFTHVVFLMGVGAAAVAAAIMVVPEIKHGFSEWISRFFK